MVNQHPVSPLGRIKLLLVWGERKLKTQMWDPVWKVTFRLYFTGVLAPASKTGHFLNPLDPQQTSSCTNHIQILFHPVGKSLQPVTGRRPLKAALGNFSWGAAFLYSLSDSMRPETPRTTKKGKLKKIEQSDWLEPRVVEEYGQRGWIYDWQSPISFCTGKTFL